jgi:hypothetical protein
MVLETVSNYIYSIHFCTYPVVHGAMGLWTKKFQTSVAVPLAPVRVPSQRPLAPSVVHTIFVFFFVPLIWLSTSDFSILGQLLQIYHSSLSSSFCSLSIVEIFLQQLSFSSVTRLKTWPFYCNCVVTEKQQSHLLSTAAGRDVPTDC